MYIHTSIFPLLGKGLSYTHYASFEESRPFLVVVFCLKGPDFTKQGEYILVSYFWLIIEFPVITAGPITVSNPW